VLDIPVNVVLPASSSGAEPVLIEDMLEAEDTETVGTSKRAKLFSSTLFSRGVVTGSSASRQPSIHGASSAVFSPSTSSKMDVFLRRWTVPLFLTSIVATWVALVCAYILAMVSSPEAGTGFGVVLIIIGVAASAVWLHGLKALASLAFYPLFRRNNAGRVLSRTDESQCTVAIVYCTANDFNGHALVQSIAQTHSSLIPVILDDSTDLNVIRAIDEFAAEHSVEVVRRVDRSGFKAGNLNNFLASRDGFDFFIVVDSDEVLPPNFVSRALDYFAHDASIGVVQARHRAQLGDNPFTRSFGPMLESQFAVHQMARSAVGLSTFLGRGAMISVACYEAAGGFPEFVLEDLCFSVEARRAGFTIVDASDIVCTEDFPVDYHAFKTQYRKVIEGKTEFLRRYTKIVVTSPIRLWEKIDLLLEQSIPLIGGFLGILVFLSSLVLTTFVEGARSFAWVNGVTGICAIAPLLPEVVRRVRARRPWAAIAFVVHASVLYGSCFLTTFRAILRVICGKRAIFVVTPKTGHTATLNGDLIANRPELLFAGLVGIVSMVLSGSILPALPLAIPAVATVYLARLGARTAFETAHDDRRVSVVNSDGGNWRQLATLGSTGER